MIYFDQETRQFSSKTTREKLESEYESHRAKGLSHKAAIDKLKFKHAGLHGAFGAATGIWGARSINQGKLIGTALNGAGFAWNAGKMIEKKHIIDDLDKNKK